MHAIEVSIPSFRSEGSNIEKGYTVFKIEVLMCGRQHTVEKRYSEFHALHKMLKKIIKPLEIPSKHVRNWVPKVLEQRRQGLELYLQTIIMENEVLPKIFLDFLNIRHFPSILPAAKTKSCNKLCMCTCIVLQIHLMYVSQLFADMFSNMVIEGVIRGIFYPDFQPR
uniref:PX domain-containing protein n=1 Tax=Sinocyclocheilus grahami TaxID=75366 RepID=A0A672NNU7_SINGR